MRIIILYFILVKIMYGYINIYPSFFYKKLVNKEASETFVLTNRSNKVVGYRIYFEDNNLEKNIIGDVYPKSIVLKPFEKKEVKVLLTQNKNNLSGEFSKTLVIKEIYTPNSERKKIYSKLKLKLLVYTNDLKAKLDGTCFIENKQLILKLKNNSKRLGIYETYVLKDKEWIFLDKFILKSLEEDKKTYENFKDYSAIKILETNENKLVFYKELKGTKNER